MCQPLCPRTAGEEGWVLARAGLTPTGVNSRRNRTGKRCPGGVAKTLPIVLHCDGDRLAAQPACRATDASPDYRDCIDAGLCVPRPHPQLDNSAPRVLAAFAASGPGDGEVSTTSVWLPHVSGGRLAMLAPLDGAPQTPTRDAKATSREAGNNAPLAAYGSRKAVSDAESVGRSSRQGAVHRAGGR